MYFFYFNVHFPLKDAFDQNKKKVIYIKHACGLIDHVTPKVSNKIDNIIE